MSDEEVPLVSIVVPMLDELGYIEPCVESLEQQTHPRVEVIVVDGGSTDGSREAVDALAATRPWLRVVDNPARKASAAFNRGIEAAAGDFIALVAAHGEVGADFVERSLATLERTGAGGVGGVLDHRGVDRQSRAIGLAMTSPFGLASPFRYATDERVVDTIGHPVYRREALERTGSFDESLERNSDYELNYRMRQTGATLVFDPTIRTVYRPRSTLQRLARQFLWYGRGKATVLRRQPGSLQPRHLVPPAAVLGGLAAPLLCSSPAGRRLVALGGVAYVGILVAAVAHARPDRHDADTAAFLVAFPIMHAAWGAGFLWSASRGFR